MVAVQPPEEVAVTGANGFIGSHVCARLLADGFRVRHMQSSRHRLCCGTVSM